MKIRNGFVSNSSSSSFVCDTQMSLSEIKEQLQELLQFYNKFYSKKLEFEEVFNEPFIADEKYAKDMTENWYYDCKKGQKIIESKDDNSIPYELFDVIETKFDGCRNHLG